MKLFLAATLFQQLIACVREGGENPLPRADEGPAPPAAIVPYVLTGAVPTSSIA
jgi:hypothetical protein